MPPSTYRGPASPRRARATGRRLALRAADIVAAVACVAAVAVVGKGLIQQADRKDAPRILRAATPSSHPDVLDSNALPPGQMCDRRGVSIRSGVGTCILADGSEMTAADSAGRVRLDSLEMRYDGARVVDRIGSGRSPLRPAGVFIRVRVTLTNRLDGAASFADDQITLALGPEDQFGPNSFADDSDPQALARRAAELRAGQSVQGRVTWDVPRRAARNLTRFGSVRVVDFGNRRDAPRFGMIRTNR